MNIQLRSYLEAELSKARVDEERIITEVAAAQKQLDELTRQKEDKSTLIAGMRKLLAKADAEEMSGSAKKGESTDAPEEPEPTNMDAVWIPAWEVSDAQMQFASDRGEVKTPSSMHVEYLIQWAMLTDEQKAKAKKDAQEGEKS